MERKDRDLEAYTRRRLIQRGALLGGGLIITPTLLAACGGSSGTTAGTTAADTAAGATTAAGDAPRAGGVFRVAISDAGPTEVIDPHAVASAADQYRSFNVFDLLAEENLDGSIAPHLAESIEPGKDDSTEWIVKLRSGVEFHDGSPLTADDVLWTFNRIGGSEDQPYFATVDPYIDLKQTAKVDDLTVRFVLKQPFGNFPWFLAQKPLHIIKNGQSEFKSIEDAIGTGPFVLKGFTAGKQTTMERFANYFKAPQPYFDAVEVIQIPKESQKAALLAGQIDGTEMFDQVAQALELQDNPAAQLLSIPAANVPQFYMRMDAPPFDDPKVREAMKLAIDREALLDISFQGEGQLGNDMHGITFPSYPKDLPQRAYDPEKAKALLKEAGQENLTVELVTGLYPDQAAAYAQQAKAAGITINLKKIPAADVYNTDLYYLKVPFGETSWGNSSFEFIAPMAYVKGAPYNETAFADPAWDKAFTEATGISDPDERNAKYRELQQVLYDTGGEIIWNWGDGLVAANPKLRGFEPQVPGFPWNDLRFREYWYAE
ncbi:MAG: ABC transporter substrate-binding protein [Actinomycetota bacterium]